MFGEIVVMLLQGTVADIPAAQAACNAHLTKYARPKHIIPVETLPLTSTGKPARSQAAALAAESLGR